MNMLVASASLASATPAITATEPDPIYVLIERHRAAYALTEKAWDAITDLEDTVPDELLHSPKVYLTRLIVGMGQPDEEIYAYTHQGIDEHVERRLAVHRALKHDTVWLEARRASLHRKLTMNKKILDGKRKRAGLTTLEDHAEMVFQAHLVALDALYQAVPITAAGARAAMEYLVEAQGGFEPSRTGDPNDRPARRMLEFVRRYLTEAA